jgi:hypothetical protein
MVTRWILTLLVLSPVAGCRAAPATPVVPLDQRVGWVNGSCLAIMNSGLQPNGPITVVALDDKPALMAGRIVGSTNSSGVCAPLLEDRRRSNDKWSFYEVRLDGKADLGIAVTGEGKPVDGGIDLTVDGKPEQFTQCSTAEGISFRVWSGVPYRGTPLWSGYYYLGYDTVTTCPS